MEVVGIGGLLVGLGCFGSYLSKLSSHKANCKHLAGLLIFGGLKEAPIVFLEDQEGVKQWQDLVAQQSDKPGRFVIVVGTASSGPHNAIEIEGKCCSGILIQQSRC
jgi:hypothetical protein